jgi:Cu-Zn family superoxide dismutase
VRIQILLIAPMMLAACATPDELGPVEGSPSVPLVNGAGAKAGAVAAERRAGGTYVRVALEGLAPGEHGIHLHAVGRCDGPDFQSAGPHWNPAATQHGHLNPQGAHAGDLPNIIVSANGRGAANFLVRGELADADGTSLVVHAKPDDYRTDPSGNSGDRIACAVIAPPTSL